MRVSAQRHPRSSTPSKEFIRDSGETDTFLQIDREAVLIPIGSLLGFRLLVVSVALL